MREGAAHFDMLLKQALCSSGRMNTQRFYGHNLRATTVVPTVGPTVVLTAAVTAGQIADMGLAAPAAVVASNRSWRSFGGVACFR